MSSREIGELQTKTENEFKANMESLNILEQADIDLSKQIVELQLKRKNLASGIQQGKYNLRKLGIERKQLERNMWEELKAERGY